MHSSSELNNVIHLRRQNKSYSEIKKITNISKSTISGWLSEKDWSVEIKNKLTEKHLKNYKPNLLKAIEVMTRQKKLRHDTFIKDAKIEYEEFRNNPLFLFGLGLYWGEGDKKSGSSVEVINTDPNLLLVISKFYRKFLHVDESKLRIRLFIYKDINREFTMDFWSKLLGIPISQFIKVQVLESRAKLTKRKSKYGICSLYFSNTEVHVKILEWIRLSCIEMQV